MEGFIKPYEQNEIEFVPNNFGFDKNMQGDRCMMMHDITMMQKRKITNNF
jgi:hypothetical protein